MNNSLYGKSCIGFLRTGSAVQGPASIASQKATLRRFAFAHQLWLKDVVVLEGISGQHTEPYIDELVRRKMQQNDFDILLVTSWDRLTRAGAHTTTQILVKLQRAGISVACPLGCAQKLHVSVNVTIKGASDAPPPTGQDHNNDTPDDA